MFMLFLTKNEKREKLLDMLKSLHSEESHLFICSNFNPGDRASKARLGLVRKKIKKIEKAMRQLS